MVCFDVELERSLLMKFLVLLFLAILTGCAAKKQAKPSPAHMAIPQDCVLDFHFTKETVCRDLGDGSNADCSHIKTHYSCVRAVKAK